MSDPLGETVLLDDRIRGVPPGTRDLPLEAVGAQNWHPADGRMALPVLTLDEAAFAQNSRHMLDFVRSQGVAIAPHAKTPMAPALARSLIAGGAWGTTVADLRQASVMLRAGLTRLIIANEIGGRGGASRLAGLVRAWPEATIYVFADSMAALDALVNAWSAGDLPPLRVLVEVGAARAGARDLEAARALVDAVAQAQSLVLAGVGTYEGAAAVPDAERTLAVIDGLLDLTTDLFHHCRARVGPGIPLILTAGGSAFFDRVIGTLQPVTAEDGAATLVLRSGAIFFNDHGAYERALAGLDTRGLKLGSSIPSVSAAFRPVLRVWAEVLSCPEPGLAICGMGMRDVSSDQDLPRPLQVYRAGIGKQAVALSVTRLNDQHAFLSTGEETDLEVGDVIEFGISHPCTCLQLYRVIFGADETGRIAHAYPTYFG